MKDNFSSIEMHKTRRMALQKEGNTSDFTRQRFEGYSESKLQLTEQYDQKHPGLAGGWGESVEDFIEMLKSPMGVTKIERLEKKYTTAIGHPDVSEDIKNSYQGELFRIRAARLTLERYRELQGASSSTQRS